MNDYSSNIEVLLELLLSLKFLFSYVALRHLFYYGEENWNKKQFTLAFLALLMLR